MSSDKCLTKGDIPKLLDEKWHPLLLTINGLKDSVKFLSEKFDNVYKKVEELDKKVSDVQSENKCLKAEVLRLSGMVERQNNELNEIEQYSRRDCVEISGLPEEKGEDLNKLVVRIGSLMNVELDKKDISISQRLPKSRSENERNKRPANNSAKVVVEFTWREIKDKFYRGCLQLKDKSTRDLGLSRISENKLYITESLSQRNKQLFKDCLKFKHDQHFRYIWTYNGKIIFKKECGKSLTYHQWNIRLGEIIIITSISIVLDKMARCTLIWLLNMSSYCNLPKFELTSRLYNLPNLKGHDVDNNLLPEIDFKYSQTEFLNEQTVIELKKPPSFSVSL